MNQTIICFFLVITSIISYAQTEKNGWQLIDDDDAMQIYYRKIEGTEIKELRLLFSSPALPIDWVNAISNVEKMSDWSHTCRSTTLLKKTNNHEVFFYYIADIPWPITGRDVVLHMQIFQDSVTKDYSISSENFVGLVEEKEEYIRTDFMKAFWTFKRVNNSTEIEYSIALKLSNSFPDWLVTKAITYSPLKSIESLREIVE